MSTYSGLSEKRGRSLLKSYGYELNRWGVYHGIVRVRCKKCYHVFDTSCKSLASGEPPVCRKCELAVEYAARWEKRTGMVVTITHINPIKATFQCVACGTIRTTAPHGNTFCRSCYDRNIELRVQKNDALRVSEKAHKLGLAIRSVNPPVLYCVKHDVEVPLTKKGSRLWGCCNECYSDTLSHKIGVSARKRMTTKKYQEKLDRVHGGTIVVAGEYDPSSRINLRCKECGFTWHRQRQCRVCGCPNCAQLRREYNWSRHSEVFIRRRRFRVQGYEANALRILARHFSVRQLEDAQRHKIVISLGYKGSRQLRYYPDLYVRQTNTIVEVKSLATAGLGRMRKWSLSSLQNKARATRRAGYVFKLMVMRGDGTEIKMPRAWRRMSVSEIKRYLRGKSNRRRAS